MSATESTSNPLEDLCNTLLATLKQHEPFIKAAMSPQDDVKDLAKVLADCQAAAFAMWLQGVEGIQSSERLDVLQEILESAAEDSVEYIKSSLGSGFVIVFELP